MNEFEKNENIDVENNIDADQEIACPFCGETISIMDEVCPHCNVSVASGEEFSEGEIDFDEIFPKQKRNVTSITLEVLAYVVAAVFLFMVLALGITYIPELNRQGADFAQMLGILLEMAKGIFYGCVGFGVLKGLSFLTDDNF
jgi:hypothetical protein